MTPSKSAVEFLNGKHDFNSYPLCPLGCAVEMYVMSSKRKLRGEQIKSDFYIGTSRDHYRCHEVQAKETKKTRVGQKVFF